MDDLYKNMGSPESNRPVKILLQDGIIAGQKARLEVIAVEREKKTINNNKGYYVQGGVMPTIERSRVRAKKGKWNERKGEEERQEGRPGVFKRDKGKENCLLTLNSPLGSKLCSSSLRQG